MSIRHLIILAGAVAMFVLVGCTAPKFFPVASVPPDKALVYIYREAALGGIAGDHYIFVNGKLVTSLYSGSYCPYFATPGTNIFTSKMISPSALMDLTMNEEFKNNACWFNAEAGKTYYVQFRIATTWGPKIRRVDAEKGAKGIASCRLSEPLQ